MTKIPRATWLFRARRVNRHLLCFSLFYFIHHGSQQGLQAVSVYLLFLNDLMTKKIALCSNTGATIPAIGMSALVFVHRPVLYYA